jgi:hypothetical protein
MTICGRRTRRGPPWRFFLLLAILLLALREELEVPVPEHRRPMRP